MGHQRPLLFFDYVDPLSYALELEVASIEAGSEIEVERRPFELNPPPGDLLDPAGTAWVMRWEEVADRFARHGLAVRRPPLLPWTRKAHELAMFARAHGAWTEVHRSLFRAFLVDSRDIGRVDVLVELAVDAGLDFTAVRAALDVDRYATEVESAQVEAERLGVQRVPTLLVRSRTIDWPVPGEDLKGVLKGQATDRSSS